MSKWPLAKIGNVATVIGGGTPKTGESENWDGTVPWVTPKDLSTQNSQYIERGARHITETGLSSCSAVLVPAGTVLWSSRAPIGLTAIARNPICTNQGFKNFIPDKKQINSEYLYHFLRFNAKSLQEYGSGATFKEVSAKRAREITIPLPPLDEQRRIAGILDEILSVKTVSESLDSHIDKAVRAEFQRSLGHPLHPENLALVAPIGKIAQVTTGNTPSRKVAQYYGPGIEWIKSDNLGDIYPSNAAESLTEEGVKVGRIAEPGSILVTCIAGSQKSIGKCSLADRRLTFNQQINSILPGESINSEFLLWQIRLFPEIIQAASTEGMKRIVSKSKLEAISVLTPPMKAQQSFLEFALEMTRLKELNFRRSSLAAELYNSLATRAFAGEL